MDRNMGYTCAAFLARYATLAFAVIEADLENNALKYKASEYSVYNS
ncbi:exported hypothetical protein [Desulfovibrionales bacterium]